MNADVPFVPWTGTAEWQRVYGGLYSVDWRAVCLSDASSAEGRLDGARCCDVDCSLSADSPLGADDARPFGCPTRQTGALGKDVDEALAIGDVWMARAETHGMPPAVEATLAIVRALRDWANEAHGQTVRHALASAIVRAVNDAVEPQQRAAHAVSVSKLAEVIGMPQSLVDVRHAATHDAMPVLEALIDSACLLLAWLRRAYWEPQRLWAVDARGAVKGAIAAFLHAAIPDEISAEEERDAKRSRVSGAVEEASSARPGRCAASIGERPLQSVLTRFLSDVPHVACSPAVQRMLCDAIVDALPPSSSDAREAALALLVHAVMASAETQVFSSLLDACLEREALPCSFVTRVASRISDARTLRSAATRCVLAARGDAWRAVVAGSPIRPSPAMDALVVRLLSKGTEAVPAASDLLLRSNEALCALAPVAAHDALYAPVHGWDVLCPPPLGCTASFNVSQDYALMYSL